MTQEAIAVSTTPPLPGLQMVQQVNAALETIATDFAGPDDPAATAGPLMTWADTANKLIKRRNEAGSAWITQGAFEPIATQAQTNAGLADASFVTPKTLRFGVSWMLGANGYLALPSWLGGFIFQWGVSAVVSTGTSAATTLPIAFPNDAAMIAVISYRAPAAANPANGNPASVVGLTSTAIAIKNGGLAAAEYSFFAVGR